ncbi:Spo0E family sporulation regulatory protein-aspartic acid phosphatase [Desulforamulus ruminis]
MEDLRKKLKTASIGKQLSDLDVVKLSDKLDAEIIKFYEKIIE